MHRHLRVRRQADQAAAFIRLDLATRDDSWRDRPEPTARAGRGCNMINKTAPKARTLLRIYDSRARQRQKRVQYRPKPGQRPARLP